MNGSSRRLTKLQEESFKIQMGTHAEDRPFINQSVSKMRDSYSTSFGSKVSQYSHQIEERFIDPKILSSSTFAVELHEDKNQSGTSSSWLTQKKFHLPPQSVSQTQKEHIQFYRSISSSLGSNVMRQTSYKEGADPSMSKTFTESNSLPPQKRVFKIKAFDLIPSGQALDSNLSLGETLKWNREIKERIEKEKADAGLNKLMQTAEAPVMRIRPATPSLNLLKIKKQRQLGLPLQPMTQINGDISSHPTLRRRKKLPHRLGQLQPLEKLPQLPVLPSLMQSSASFNLRKQKILEEAKSIAIPVDLDVKVEFKGFFEDDQDLFDRDVSVNEEPLNHVTQNIVSSDKPSSEDEYYDEEVDDQPGAVGLLSNFQEKFEEIVENDEVEDAIELNEKFLAEHLGVKSEELQRLTKIELRVDTSCHNLQVTGEILSSLESLRMNDSIIRCFRDIGTSFRFVRILHLARCELIEVQGIQAFINLEELYISYNYIDELFDVGFLEHLRILDFEGNNVKAIEQIQYLKRCRHLIDVNLKYNPVSQSPEYYDKLILNVPNLTQLDDEQFIPDISSAQTVQQENSWQSISDVVKQSSIISRLLSLFSIQEKMLPTSLVNLIKQSLYRLQDDDSDLSIMVANIKSYPIEKKAQRQIFEHLVMGQEEQDLASYVQKMTPQKDRTRHGSALKNSTTTGFGSRRKSANYGAANDENDGRASNKSDEVAKSPLKSQISPFTGGKKVLRIKRSKIITSTVIEDPHQQPKVQFYGSRSQVRPPSVLEENSYSGLQALNKHSNQSRDSLKHTSSTKSVIMAETETLQDADSFALQGEQIQSGGVLKQNVRGSFSSTNTSYLGGLSKGGGSMVKAERIVLRPQDIQFIKKK